MTSFGLAFRRQKLGLLIRRLGDVLVEVLFLTFVFNVLRIFGPNLDPNLKFLFLVVEQKFPHRLAPKFSFFMQSLKFYNEGGLFYPAFFSSRPYIDTP